MISNLKNPKAITLLLFYLLASFIIIAMIPSPSLVDKKVGALPLINFEGYKPFQYRVLMPLIIRGIESITPGFVKRGIGNFAANKIEAHMRNQDIAEYKVETITQNAFRAILYICLRFLIVFFALAAFWKLASAFNYLPGSLSALLPAV